MEHVKSALIFASGKVVFTGAKTKDSIDNAFIELKKKMEKFRKSWFCVFISTWVLQFFNKWIWKLSYILFLMIWRIKLNRHQMSPPGTGNWDEKSFTSFLSWIRLGLEMSACRASLKSFSFVPLASPLIFLAIAVARSINFIIWTKSAYLHPRVVIAGLPIRIPEGIKALLSPGTVFLLIETEI